ncbi:MAG TPA: dihydropteroate synthase [Acidimicrobiia bacterium]|nr:dihydropteroate synthase [Acidimicrobiia bacterium]
MRGRVLDTAAHTLVMGALNVTPDSFSDGGLHADAGSAVARGLEMLDEGADLVDVGGESTRPGAEPVDAEEELRRVIPVVRSLAAAGAVISIDTFKAEVADAALAAGAAAVNDITALGDPGMAGVVASAGAGLVLMHMQGTPRTMQEDPRYEDVVAEVARFLAGRAAAAQAGGIDPACLCVDPGIGFGKGLEHNLALLRGIPDLAVLGHPVLVGASRKRFLAGILGTISPGERDAATSAAHVLAIAGGAAVIRVHNVVVGLQTARVADAIVRAVPARG